MMPARIRQEGDRVAGDGELGCRLSLSSAGLNNNQACQGDGRAEGRIRRPGEPQGRIYSVLGC